MAGNWWSGPWNCLGCWFTTRRYDNAERHRRSTGHTLENERGGN